MAADGSLRIRCGSNPPRRGTPECTLADVGPLGYAVAFVVGRGVVGR
jgi:hypothetical protein